ncbi:MAG: multidrug resistance efflux transporter family protein [Sporomusaceae bacterium]|nr:multidrug resistance efflux transporter family protein [Sporomusaceae bacterium]
MQLILIGILASLFFSSTFILNRAMDLSGGSWIWSASLRYFFMVPFLVLIVMARRNMRALLDDMKTRPLEWITWSSVGFGLFYAPLCFAAAYGPAWLVAGTWQFTIVAGSLLAPFFYKKIKTANDIQRERHKIPVRELVISLFILIGVGLIQERETENADFAKLIIGILPVLIAAFAYPLGNRKMMSICEERLDVYQRVLGMTIASLPFWLVLSFYGVTTIGLPSSEQVMQSFIVAIFSGIVATVLFFYATDKAKGNPKKLAVVEATQSGEVAFTVAGEVLFLGGVVPIGWPLIGIVIIIAGMILHSMNLRENATE